MSAQDDWKNHRIVGNIWWCGDDVCDCQQAQIMGIKPNLKAGPPFFTPTMIWSGTFFSDGEGGSTPKLELIAEIKRLARLGVVVEAHV